MLRYMDDGEIYRNWKRSAEPKKQILILAELNNLSKSEIKSIIANEQKKEAERDALYKNLREGIKLEESMAKLEKEMVKDKDKTYDSICKRLDELDILIKGYEKEYRRLSEILKKGTVTQ